MQITHYLDMRAVAARVYVERGRGVTMIIIARISRFRGESSTSGAECVFVCVLEYVGVIIALLALALSVSGRV